MATPICRSGTRSGFSPKKRNMNSSTMKVAQAIVSQPQQRRSRIGASRSGWVRKSFCILLPEIRTTRFWKLCRGGSLGHAWPVGTTGPTNVTAVVKSQTNRARSVAAGMVSGAGFCQPVFQTPHSDESASSRSRQSLHPVFWPFGRRRGVVAARQLQRRVRANGWCRAQLHTRKKRRDQPIQWGGGWVEAIPPARLNGGQSLAHSIRDTGT